MRKIYFNIIVLLIVSLLLGTIIYKNNKKNNDINNVSTLLVDQNGWTTITDCRDIKLYLWDGKNPSEAGLEDEQDVAGDLEKKILSIGLPESIYGPRKRLEVSYAKPSDYENCSPDVKRVIKDAVGL